MDLNHLPDRFGLKDGDPFIEVFGSFVMAAIAAVGFFIDAAPIEAEPPG